MMCRVTKIVLGLLLFFNISHGNASIPKDADNFGNKMSKMLEDAGINVKVNCRGTKLSDKTFFLICKWIDEEKKSATVSWIHTGHGEDDIKMHGSHDTEAGTFAQDFFELLKVNAQNDFFKVK